MINLALILDNLKIEYSMKEREDRFTYYCLWKETDKSNNFPFMISHIHEIDVVNIYFPRIHRIEKEDKNVILQIINKYNNMSLFGNFYIDDRMYLEGYIGMLLNSTEDSLTTNQLKLYLTYFTWKLTEISHEIAEYYSKLTTQNKNIEIKIKNKYDGIVT